jgi:hypothetical protein
MSKYMTNITAAELLSAWLNAGFVSQSESAELQSFILSQQQEKELPLYLRILVGIGAFISSSYFIFFLSAADIINFDSKGEIMFWGLVFIGSALFLARLSGDKDHTVKHSFFLQTSFCAMGIGKILFVTGFGGVFSENDGWGVTLATSLITLATYPVYRMSIDRFLSTLVIFTSVLINIVHDAHHFGAATEVLLNVFFLSQIILAAFLLTHGKVKRDYIPLAYATAFSLCITVIYFTMESKIGAWDNKQNYSLAFVNILLMLSLVGLIGWAAGNLEKLKTEPLMLATLGAVLLAILSAPGILLSICLMVLGYAKHEKLLLLMGMLLMPMFIFFYYYNLDISLMAKSGILIGSGVVLLAGRGYLAVKKLDREI